MEFEKWGSSYLGLKYNKNDLGGKKVYISFRVSRRFLLLRVKLNFAVG